MHYVTLNCILVNKSLWAGGVEMEGVPFLLQNLRTVSLVVIEVWCGRKVIYTPPNPLEKSWGVRLEAVLTSAKLQLPSQQAPLVCPSASSFRLSTNTEGTLGARPWMTHSGVDYE